ncbi:MAG: hypothetical protein QOD51_2309, partial [Candidatus Eremiobacteraeota bacterium]|nr:hypothetical protein [Candidatus Eremiobacteraeota bacterium]
GVPAQNRRSAATNGATAVNGRETMEAMVRETGGRIRFSVTSPCSAGIAAFRARDL